MIIRLGSLFRFSGEMLVWAIFAVVSLGVCHCLDGATQSLSDRQIESSIEKLGVSDNASLSESSGLAISQTKNTYWTINDSGTGSMLFLIHQGGETLAEYAIDCRNIDWEAMSQFNLGEQSWLVIADVGDNLRRRKSYQLQFFPEPKYSEEKKLKKSDQGIKPIEVEVHFSADGSDPRDLKDDASDKLTKPINCEAVAVDPLTNEIWFVEKVEITSPQKTAPGIFVLPLPETIKDSATPKTDRIPKAETPKHIAKRIASFPIRNVTGMAFSPDGKNLVVRNYLNAHLYRRSDEVSWQETIAATKPVTVVLPLQRQGEAVCFTPDSESLILTSEVNRQPIWRVGLEDYFDMPIRKRTRTQSK